MLRNLAIAFVVLLVVTLLAYRQPRVTKNALINAPLIQGLDVAQIGRIVITAKNPRTKILQTTTLSATHRDLFTIAEKNNYLADTEEINELLRTLLDIRIASVVESSNLSSPHLSTENTARLEIFNRAEILSLSLIVGATYGNGNYVTLNGETLISAVPIILNGEPLEYLNPLLLKIDGKNLRQINITRGSEKFSLIADRDGIIKLSPLLDGKNENANAVWNLREALSYLTIADVAPMGENKLAEILHAEIISVDEMVYQLRLFKPAEKYQLTITAVEPNNSADIMLKDRVMNFNRQHHHWLYTLTDELGEQLDKKMSDLIKP